MQAIRSFSQLDSDNTWNDASCGVDKFEAAKSKIDLNGFFERLSYQGLFNDFAEDKQSKYFEDTWSDDSTDASLSIDSLSSSASSPILQDLERSSFSFSLRSRQSENNTPEPVNAIRQMGSQPFSNITNIAGVNSSSCGKNDSINFMNKNQPSNAMIQQKFQGDKKVLRKVRLANAIEIILSQPNNIRFAEQIKVTQQPTTMHSMFHQKPDLPFHRTSSLQYPILTKSSRSSMTNVITAADQYVRGGFSLYQQASDLRI